MTRNYLIGPVTADFAEQYLRDPRADGRCLAFNAQGTTDLTIGHSDTWEAVSRRFPPGWRPDFVALYLPYTTIPAGLWSAPVPLVGLAADWNLLWHHYRRCLPSCDLVVTDLLGVEVMQREGIAHARAANLFGCAASFLEPAPADTPRDIDVLFVGNLNPAVQRERLAWLGRLARLSDRWRVVIETGVFGDAYRDLLRRARVVFNHSIRGECNRRAVEAAAAGALLFQEAGNREVPAYFQPGREYVAYTADDLEALLEHYLEHEDERQVIAAAGQARAPKYSFDRLWQEQLRQIDGEWDALIERARTRAVPDGSAALLARVWQAQGSSDAGDPSLEFDLATALIQQPESAALHHALGLATYRPGQSQDAAALAARAAGHFRRAIERDPGEVLAALNLAESLAASGQKRDAIDQARRALGQLHGASQRSAAALDGGPFPPGFGLFRVEWERAAWAQAGDPAGEQHAKLGLIRWRLHGLLAELTRDLPDAYEAVLARPDLPSSRALLGFALARHGRPAEAATHLRQALRANPFDRAAARACFQALGAADDGRGQRRLACDRRLLHRAAPQAVPAEDWLLQVPPPGDELASILVLCCNQLDCTRLCLESVLAHTRPPFELVLVDNGSTDGTPAYLDELRTRLGPACVVVVRNETNRGFPAGCNQALAEAKGDYLVLLNNDTVVCDGWLDGLVAWALHDWPAVGLVGAVSNYAPPPQQVEPGYADLDGLPAFAARRRRAFARRALQVDRLTGFCLLIRRQALDKIGGFDERYGLGFFDDDDLCVRAREAGFRLLLALDVYVHHFGSRTFRGLGVDCAQQLRDNLEQFQAKWGAERAAGYCMPETIPAEATVAPDVFTSGTQPASRPRVSLCMIVRNEEANLPACLASAEGLCDEIIVVDTGSTDRTREVAAALGARVYEFAWVDSFAAARNESLRHATGDWVFWLDADDRLPPESRDRLRGLFAALGAEHACYAMKCVCLPDPVSGATTVVDHVRLFRNDPAVRWRYRVHEQILPAVRQAGGEVRWADVAIHHVGYQDPALRRGKLERDLRLLRLEDAEHPDDPFTLFNLGSVFLELGRPAEALPVLSRSLERSAPEDSIVRKLHTLLVQCHRQLGDHDRALAACRAGRRHYPDDAELLFHEGLVRRARGDGAGAEACLLRLLEGHDGPHFASVDAGLRGYKARHNLAVLYQEAGRTAEAEAQWRAALAGQPDLLPGWLGLAELFLGQGRWDELEHVAGRLEDGLHAATEAAVLRARGALARQEFGAARTTLEAAIAAAPAAVWPRVLLSHVLLQEGRDWPAAERALRDVLALEPGHAEARCNLAVLAQQQARPSA
jgi:GT2 family glycosyltransferase/tetratricopeptide (TPR) repeat protein